MITGIFAGVTWALETVILGLALGMTPFISTAEGMFLAPFVSTFLHDTVSALFMIVYNAIRGNFRELVSVFRKKNLIWLVLASAVGGPVGMSGYVLAVRYMGSAIGAVASAVYPAVGTILAAVFLKEKVSRSRWIFLILTLAGVLGLSWSPDLAVENFWLGLLGAMMCACGWGVEAVILARCFRDGDIRDEIALTVRQSVSALIYGTVLMPLLGGWPFTAGLVTGGNGRLIGTVGAAAVCASVSYLLYYRTIAKLGASKAMALNITYTAWAIVFTVLICRDFSLLNPMTLICAGVVVFCGICAAGDLKEIFGRNKSDTHTQEVL